MAMREHEPEISFILRKRLGVLSTSATGWKKELNLVEWNGRPVKLDIREWDPEHQHMSKGITLRRDEAERLQFLLYRFLTANRTAAAQAKEAGRRAADGDDADFAAESDGAPDEMDTLLDEAAAAFAGDAAVETAGDADTVDGAEAPLAVDADTGEVL